jgi:hypothetical protein
MAAQQREHPRLDRQKDVGDLGVAGWIQAAKAWSLVAIIGVMDEHAVGQEGVKVRRELQRRTEALHEGDRPRGCRARRREAKLPCPATLEREQRADGNRTPFRQPKPPPPRSRR